MSRISLLFSLAVTTFGCRAAAPVDTPASSAPDAESRATAMPESLRCNRADECAPEPNCYWSEPKCVAAATVVNATCGTDADPQDASRAGITCGCQSGQCVTVRSP